MIDARAFRFRWKSTRRPAHARDPQVALASPGPRPRSPSSAGITRLAHPQSLAARLAACTPRD